MNQEKISKRISYLESERETLLQNLNQYTEACKKLEASIIHVNGSIAELQLLMKELEGECSNDSATETQEGPIIN